MRSTRIASWLDLFNELPELYKASRRVARPRGEVMTTCIPSTKLDFDLLELLTRGDPALSALINLGPGDGWWVSLDDLAERTVKSDFGQMMLQQLQSSSQVAETFDFSQPPLKLLLNLMELLRKAASECLADNKQEVVESLSVTEPARSSDDEEEGFGGPSRFAVTHVLADREEVAHAVKRSGSKDVFTRAANHNALVLLQKSIRRELPAAETEHLAALEGLKLDFPHFDAVLTSLQTSLKLRQFSEMSSHFLPVLLVGPPGIGKTAFVRRLSAALGMVHHNLDCGSLSAGWIIKGSHIGWASPQLGEIASSLLALPQRKALLMQLDEIDKITLGTPNYPLTPTLLSLLEPMQAGRFKEEFLGVHLNLTEIVSFMATANSLDLISPPIRSRFQIFEIPLPDSSQMPAVVRSIDREFRDHHLRVAGAFEPLSDAVVKELCIVNPRALCRLLPNIYALAIDREGSRASGLSVCVEDVKAAKRGATLWPSEPSQSTEGTGTFGEDDWFMGARSRSGPDTGGSTPPTIH